MLESLLCIRGETTKDIRLQLERILRGHPPCLAENEAKALTLSILHAGKTDLLGKVAKARDLIHEGAEIEDSHGIFFTPTPWGPSRVAFLFPGQGIRIHGMLSSFMDELPGFQHEIEDIRSLWLTLDGRDLFALMCEGDCHSNNKTLTETQNAQPTIGMLSDALASALSHVNIQPRFFAGHSFGELSALRAAGALGREAFLRMSRRRGYLLAKAGERAPGAMTSVMASLDKVKELLTEVDGTLAVACLNAPEQTVVAGELAAIRDLETTCRERKIRAVRLSTPCAFHSPLMSPVREDWKGYLEESSRTDEGFKAPPQDVVFSNVTAQTYPEDKRSMTDLLCRQIVSPVRWEEICKALYERGTRIFVEVGPDAVLTGLLRGILTGKPYLGLSCKHSPGDSGSGLLAPIARLASHGVPVRWQLFYREGTRPSLSLRDEPERSPYANAESIPHGRSSEHTDEESKTLMRTLKASLEGNRRLLESFFRAQESILDLGGHGGTGGLGVEVLSHLLQSNQTVMDAFMSVQQEVGRFVTGQSLPFESFRPAVPAAITRRVEAWEADFGEGPSRPGQPEIVVGQESISLRRATEDMPFMLEDWLRNEIADLTGFPPESVSLDARFDHDFGLESITLVQIAVRMMEVFPETRRLETELHQVRSLRMLHNLLKDAGIPGGDRTEEVARIPEEESLTPVQNQDSDAPRGAAFHPTPEQEAFSYTASLDSVMGRWGEVERWLSERLAASSGMDAGEITQSTDFFDDLHLDSFVYEEIVEELEEKMPEIRVAGYALQNTRNIQELRNLIVAVSAHEDSERTGPCAEQSAERAGPEPVERFVLVETPYACRPEDDFAAIPSPIILAGCEGPLFEHYRRSLEDCGIEVVPLRLSGSRWEVTLAGEKRKIRLEDARGLANVLDRYCEGSRIPGFLFLAMGRKGCSPTGDSSDWIDGLEHATTGLFSLAKAFSEGRSENDISGRLFAVIGSRAAGPGWGAAAGLTRSLSREWPGVSVSYSLLDGRPEDFALKRILTQLLAKKREDELVFGSAGVRCLKLVKRPLRRAVIPESELRIGPDSLLLLTGGGSGITAALGCMFAEKYRCRMVAVGRTPWPQEDRFALVTDRRQLKRCIYEELARENRKGDTLPKRDGPAVRARFQEVERQRSLLKTAAKIKAAGGSFCYYRADCTDKDEWIGVVDRIHKEAGPIHGLIHGAGITSDSLLSQKDLAAFRRVVYTKARSSFQLYHLLKEDPLEFALFLSSLSSYAGRPGQTDYAAANEALNALAEEWNRQAPYPVKSLLWSVWTETGLAGEGIRMEMKRLGLGGIRTAEGVRLSHEEILRAPKADSWVLFSPGSILQHVTGRRV